MFATTFTTLTATAHCQLMLSFQQGSMGTEWPLEQKDLGSKSSFAIYLLIVQIFHISLLSVDNVMSTYCCSLIYSMLTVCPNLSPV